MESKYIITMIKAIALILWIIAGITTIIGGTPTLFTYILCWVMLLLFIIKDIWRDYK